MTSVCAPWNSERTEAPSEGLIIGSTKDLIYTAALHKCSSWKKSSTGVLKTEDSNRVISDLFCCTHNMTKFTTRAKYKLFLLLFTKQRFLPPPHAEVKAFQWFILGYHKDPFLVYFSHDPTSHRDERVEFS